jgi:sigma-B regulation protein RsbU (phosphoserine phosphatase)
VHNNILIVDDMAVNRKLIKAVLKEMQGIDFYDAEDGFQAIKEVEDNDIDLIILDLMMPGKDGFEVLKELKADPNFKEIPIVVYSGMDNIDSINQALELGAYDYFTKPLTMQQIKFIVPAKVKNALESYVHRKELVRMHEKVKLELMLASVFQQTLMSTYQQGILADMYGKYLPCEEIGGNFYECVQFENCMWFIMADVSNHGVAAAMIASMIKVEFNNCVGRISSPAEVLKHMNNTFYQMMKGDYSLTAFIGKVEAGNITYANADHIYPILYKRSTDSVSIIAMKDAPIGVVAEAEYTSQCIKVGKDDAILLYTAGLFDTREQYDLDMNYQDLCSSFVTYKDVIYENPEEFLNIMLRLFAGIVDEKVMNDVAMMLVLVR